MKQHTLDYGEVSEMKTAVSLHHQLQHIQRVLFMALGAALTFLLFALANADQIGSFGFFLWLMLLFGPSATSFLLLISPVWRLLALKERSNTILLGFGVSWLALLIFYVASLRGGYWPTWVRVTYWLFLAGYLLFMLGLGFAMQRRSANDETLFP